MISIWTSLLCLVFSVSPDNASKIAAADEATGIQPLLIGSATPSVTVKDPSGKDIDLAEFLMEKPTVLVFYRGSWCPYCMKNLASLQKLLPELEKQGYRLAALTQDSPEINTKTMAKHKLGFTILSDGDMAAADAFGLVFKVDPETTKRYVEYGIDLVGLYGRTEPVMAVPGVFIFNEKGKLRFQYVNPDYRIRLALEILMAAVKAE